MKNVVEQVDVHITIYGISFTAYHSTSILCIEALLLDQIFSIMDKCQMGARPDSENPATSNLSPLDCSFTQCR